MPVVKQQGQAKPKAKGVLGRIAPVTLGEGLIKMNVYGRSGTGKTTLACTFPKDLLLVGIEDGTKSVHNVKGVDFVRIYASEELTEVIQHLRSSKYQTVVLDTASTLQDLILKETLGLDELPVQRSWGMASRETWGQVTIKVKEYLRALLDLRMHTVIIAQERNFNDEGGSELLAPTVASALSPSVVGWLNPACDYLVQTFIRNKTKTSTTKINGKEVTTTSKLKEVEYCLRTAPDEVYTTKFRLPKGCKLPEVIVDPDYAKIAKIIAQGA